MGTESARPEPLPIDQIALVFAAMGHPIRLGVLMVLYGSEMIEDTPCLRYKQLKEITGIASDSALSHHLGRLVDAGLILKAAHKDDKNNVFPVYSAAPRWKHLIESSGLRPILRDLLAT